MAVCNGRGDRDGGHCCWIGGEVCELLTHDESGTPRCSVWGEFDNPVWLESRVGRWFADGYPGFTCADWPQNIPEAMSSTSGKCCWQEVVPLGDLG